MEQQKDVLEELQQSLESRALELSYEKACHRVEAVCDNERFRKLRVQILLLEDEIDELQSQLAQDDDRIDSLKKSNQGFQDVLGARSTSLESARGELRIKSREIETLKAELNSLHGVTMDSTKLLTEKLTMARELSSLRPEVDYLRSQAASHQSILAEKLLLQRQLSTVQVELEAEKRSTQRALAKEDKSHVEDAKSESRIEALQADLAKERRERQRIEREAQKAFTESENRKTTLESRLDAFRTKLKTTKEQLKETQAALEASQATANAASSGTMGSSNPATTISKNPRKRAGVQMDADTMIGTPGDLPAAKKTKRVSTLPGEKSTFSITPFLNRTVSVAPESPPSDNAGSGGEEDVEAAEYLPGDSRPKCVSKEVKLVAKNNVNSNKSSMLAKKPGILESTKPSNVSSTAPPVRKPKVAPILEQVAEEENSENGSLGVAVTKTVAKKTFFEDTINEGAEMKKKKRKVLGSGLGKTLFDEDEGGAVKGDGGLLGGVTGFGTLGPGGFQGTKFGLPLKAGGTSMSTFGQISPRKAR